MQTPVHALKLAGKLPAAGRLFPGGFFFQYSLGMIGWIRVAKIGVKAVS
jgi:hypothetical protein